MPARKQSTAKRTTAKRTTATKSEPVKSERNCPSCGRLHGSSFVSEAELPILENVRGRTEDSSPSGVYRVWSHEGVSYIRAHEHDDTCAAVHPQEVSK